MSTPAFEHSPGDSGFIASISPAAARRQLKISIAVVAAFVIATALALATGQIRPQTQPPAPVKLTIQMPGKIKTHHAANHIDVKTNTIKRGI